MKVPTCGAVSDTQHSEPNVTRQLNMSCRPTMIRQETGSMTTAEE